MRNVTKVSALLTAVLLLALVALPAVAAKPADPTVGRWVTELAKIKGLNATDARIALDSLRGVGIDLPADLNLSKRLTQGDVADLSRRVGLRVTTTQPDDGFSEAQLTRFFVSFGDELTAAVSEDGGPPFDPFSKAKGKGSGKAKFNRTSTEPE